MSQVPRSTPRPNRSFFMTTPSFVRKTLLVLVLLAGTGFLRAADNFQGSLDIVISNPKHPSQPPHQLHYQVKQNKVRFDFAEQHGARGGQGAMIIDFDRMETIMLMDNGSQKMSMRRPLNIPKVAPESGGSTASAPTKTGRTDTLLGYPITEYTVNDSNGNITHIWLAKGLGRFMFPAAQNMRGPSAPPGWSSFVNDGNFFPLRIVTIDKDGKEGMHMEVTKITPETVPDSAFSAEGYTEFNMGGMMQGLMPH